MATKKTGRRRGAPVGNMNAFKHGKRSRQLANAVALLVADPSNGETFMRYAERAKGRKLKALEAGALMLQHLMTRAHETGAARARAAASGQSAPRDQIGTALAELNGDDKHLMDQQIAKTASPNLIPDTTQPCGEEITPTNKSETDTTAPNKSQPDTKITLERPN